MKSRGRSFAVLLLAAVACGGPGAPVPGTPGSPPTDQGTGPVPPPGGSGGGGQVPPLPTVDGASWFIVNASAVIGAAPASGVDFGALQNTVQGGMAVGTGRSATVLVYNTSKKTPLVISEIAVVGPDAGEFSVSPASVAGALNVPIPANKNAAAVLQLAFTPAAEGVRTATLRLVSNAGTALVSLIGEGLPERPLIATNAAALTFLPTSAPDTVSVTNQGGVSLVLQSIELGGANPASFHLVVANRGFSNCFAGIALGPHGSCYLGVGPTAGAPAPSSALLVIQSNDPAHPQTAIGLQLTPAP